MTPNPLTPSVNCIHIEPTNICTLRCPGCARTQFIDRWPQHWKNHSVDAQDLLAFVDVAVHNVMFCGNDGDPIYHKEFVYIVEQFKKRNTSVSIITNGSYKTQQWWESLTALLDEKDQVIFSIDGLPQSSPLYRINSDWHSIRIGIDCVARSKSKSKWKFIPFRFNQDQIELARQLSKDLGIDEFEVSYSDRFDSTTEHLKPTVEFLGERYQQQQNWKQGASVGVWPKCSTGQEHYITASGHYVPCCYLADYRFYYKTQWGKNKTHYEIRNRKLSEILAQSAVIEFYQTLDQQQACQYNCPTAEKGTHENRFN